MLTTGGRDTSDLMGYKYEGSYRVWILRIRVRGMTGSERCGPQGSNGPALIGIIASITARELIRQSAGYGKVVYIKVPGVAHF